MERRTETKRIKIADDPFLIELTASWASFAGSSPDRLIEVVAVEGFAGDWTAYYETPTMPFHNVADYGDKLPPDAAARLFPEWATQYRWRP